MKNISKIHIENVKGIEKATFDVTLYPSIPNFFVAPNGFGKSSFAKAFDSLNRDRIKLSEENCHLGDISKQPKIEIEITNPNNTKITLTATKDKNEISKIFDIEVIKSLLKPKVNNKSFGGINTNTPTLEVEDIYIIENIPEKFELPYQITKYKQQINDNRLIWTDISYLLQNAKFVSKLAKLNILDKFSLKTQAKFIDNFIEAVKQTKGSKDEIINAVGNEHLTIVNSIFFDSLVELIEQFENRTKAEIYLIAIQLIKLYNGQNDDFVKLFEYKYYCQKKENIIELFSSFEIKWKDVTPTEIKITKKVKKKNVVVRKNFGIQFPKATDISNGERDVVSFIASLFRAQTNFRGKPTILIIDEVFDYLDDANLLAVQYYTTKFIEFFTKKNIPFFPIILTHLNPHYFKNYFFSNQKVHYLLNWKGSVDRGIENMIISRNNSKDKNYQDNLSSFFLHYNPNEHDIENEAVVEFTLQKLGNVNSHLCKSQDFRKKTLVYFENYRSGKKNYDPISVCIATRILVEKDIYEKLPVSLKQEFVETHTTVAKLNFARENSDIVIPEIYFFLGTLYNELLHIRKNNDNSSPIYLKLNNLTIRKMIDQIKK